MAECKVDWDTQEEQHFKFWKRLQLRYDVVLET